MNRHVLLLQLSDLSQRGFTGEATFQISATLFEKFVYLFHAERPRIAVDFDTVAFE